MLWEANHPDTPIWDQDRQVIILHETRLYPDLDLAKASGKSTYFKYKSAEEIQDLLRKIGNIILTNLKTEQYSIEIKADKLRFIEYETGTSTVFTTFQHILSNNLLKIEGGTDNYNNIQVIVNGKRVGLDIFGKGQNNLIVQVIPSVELSFQSKESFSQEGVSAGRRSSKLIDFIRDRSELPDDAKETLLKELSVVRAKEKKGRDK